MPRAFSDAPPAANRGNAGIATTPRASIAQDSMPNRATHLPLPDFRSSFVANDVARILVCRHKLADRAQSR
jgi:hypothetical protein